MIYLRVFVSSLCILALTSTLTAANKTLDSGPVIIEKETDNKIEVVKTYLRPRAEDGQVKIWVFFTDKNIFDGYQFAVSAAKVNLTERAIKRREKMGRQDITFGDLPVAKDYIIGIISRGGKLRRSSRWLNAASFEAPFDRIDEINNLSFVARVRPVGTYKRKEPAQQPDYGGPAYDLKGTYSLDYGPSLGQLDQVNVPAVHDLGYNGSGVLAAMFDTGYRKDHEAFADAFATSRVLAEYDFVFGDFETQNEPGIDASSQHNHGTYTWSTLGGATSGQLYGPAYGASFILAKTEDVRSETQVEEDNWVAAVEWADSIGADVISSSLGYIDWYQYSDLDGETAVTTTAANLATSYGIVVCNAMGNEGSGYGTLIAPADAFEILSCGAVNSSGDIAGFSSHGPTYDGRIKPEVCARGVSTYCASAGGTMNYSYVNGTSLSTPIIGGCAALYLSIYPTMTPQAVRLALMETASRADNPDNTYGWGIVNMLAALDWGAKIGSNVRSGQTPLEVSFFDSSYVPTTDWKWFFSVDDSAMIQNPIRTYTEPGAYEVSLAVTTSIGRQISVTEPYYIIAQADTMTYVSDSTYPAHQAIVEVELTNSQTLTSLLVPIDFSNGETLTLDSFSVAETRTSDYTAEQAAAGGGNDKYVISLTGGTPLPPGTGTVLKFYLTADAGAIGGMTTAIDSVTIDEMGLNLATGQYEYVPYVNSGEVVIYATIRGDANTDGNINVGDIVYLVNFVFNDGPAPITERAGDANADGNVNIGDAVYICQYIFHDGPAPLEK